MREEIIQKYIDLRDSEPHLEVTRDYFVRQSGVSYRQIRNHFQNFNNLKLEAGESEAKDRRTKSKEKVSDLEFSDKYIYNRESGKYIFLLESKIGKNLVISEDRVKSIIKAYSNFKGDQSSINEISVKFDIPRKFVIEILRSLEFTHDSLPVTNEELVSKDSDDLVEEILQEKRFALYQELEKRDWSETKIQAKKWRDFELGVLNPYKTYLQNFQPEPFPKITPPSKKDSDKTMIVGCFDWQIGSHADGRFLFFGEEWNTKKAIESVETFASKIVNESKIFGVKKAVVVFGGDIFHGLNGETAKGTPLKCDTIRFDQFDATVKAISLLVQRMAENFKEVDCKIISGNHEGFDYYPVFRLIEALFVNSTHVTFDICKKEFMHFQIKNSLFLITHGASQYYKHKTPKDRKGRVALAQRVARIAEREGGYKDVQRIFFIKGDTHSFEMEDLGQIMFFTFGSLPTGDEYADALTLESTPCQNALVIGDGKDFRTLHLTFN